MDIVLRAVGTLALFLVLTVELEAQVDRTSQVVGRVERWVRPFWTGSRSTLFLRRSAPTVRVGFFRPSQFISIPGLRKTQLFWFEAA